MINTERLVERFLRYVACDSESGDEQRFCLLMEDELKALGLTVSRDQAGEACGSNGWNVYGLLPGIGEPVLLCAHMDTVAPGKGIVPVVGDNGIIRSSGDTILGADDKSGVSAILEALETIIESGRPHRPVEVLFTICEEVGLLGSRNADYSRLSSREAVIFDSGDVEGIINQSPSNVVLHVQVTGKSAHAGVEPERGIHALKAAAEAVAQIPCGHVDEITVMNVSNFLSPGKTNVVPDAASFDMEVRSFSEERLQEWINKIRAILDKACAPIGASYTLESERHASALHVPEDSHLMRKLFDACRRMGLTPTAECIFGGSDATWLFANGIDAVNLGSGMMDIHGLGEGCCVPKMAQAAELILDITRPET